MSSHHKAYGLRIASNLPIPGFLIDDSRPEADVTIEFRRGTRPKTAARCDGVKPWYSSPDFDRPGRPDLQIWKRPDAGFDFLYGDNTRLEVSSGGDRIQAHSPPGLSFEDTACYVAGPALGFVLRLRGGVGIHASGVLWRKGAVLFTGHAGAGKSTTAAAMSRHGCPVLAEDIAALEERDGRFGVWKGYPRVNLWPESVSALFGSPDSLPEIAPPWSKRYLALDSEEFRSIDDPVPVHAIYSLRVQAEDGGPGAGATQPSEALLALIGNTYMNRLPGIDIQKREFDVLSRLVQRVPVRRLRIDHRDADGICAAVLDDLSRLIQ